MEDKNTREIFPLSVIPPYTISESTPAYGGDTRLGWGPPLVQKSPQQPIFTPACTSQCSQHCTPPGISCARPQGSGHGAPWPFLRTQASKQGLIPGTPFPGTHSAGCLAVAQRSGHTPVLGPWSQAWKMWPCAWESLSYVGTETQYSSARVSLLSLLPYP